MKPIAGTLTTGKPASAGSPFTNPLSNARLHANANAAFMRAVRPGQAADAGGPGSPGPPALGGGFGHTGEDHRFHPSHPDASLL